MTPEQKIKHLILLKAAQWSGSPIEVEVTAENIDELYDEAYENDGGYLQDARHEIREGEAETSLPCPSSRHYESTAVAAKYLDGSWIGWTHWYGGGKHGEPEAIDWMDDAYDLTCKEEEKLVIVRTFAKVDQVE
ncbi:MAG TPA: hypothetical protein VJ652_16440 [Noviherbaspirillum sp.]|nr:hypothetical protein [Noviherbaspirillum sp.]